MAGQARPQLPARESPRLLERVMSPMKRMAKPAEVAAAIAYLGSEEAAYVSGDSLVVDGATLAI